MMIRDGWLAYLGNGSASVLRDALSGDMAVTIGEGFGLSGPPGESPCVRCIGTGPEAFSRVIAHPDASPRPRLELTTDRFGVYSAYYAKVGDVWWCASDLRLLHRVPGVSRVIAPDVAHAYLCFSHVPRPAAITPGVQSVQAGDTVRIAAAPSIASTYVWRECPRFCGDEDAARLELRARLEEAVARRLGRHRDVGVLVSGGLDSSVVAAVLQRLGANVRLYTLDFGKRVLGELEDARMVAAALKAPLIVVQVKNTSVRNHLDALIEVLDQPFGDAVTLPLYLLKQQAAQDVAVLFNGEGGDQLFGGWANKPLIASSMYQPDPGVRERQYLDTFHRFFGLERELYSDTLYARTRGVALGTWLRPALEVEGFHTLLHRLRAANLRIKGAQNIAPRMSQLARAFGLTLHSPFFDAALADWSFSLPPQWLLSGTCEKYLLKRAVEDLLPEAIIWKEKRGMGAPVTDWVTGPAKRLIRRTLNAKRVRAEGWFKPDAVKKLRQGEVPAADYRRRRTGERLWCLFVLLRWADQRALRFGGIDAMAASSDGLTGDGSSAA